MKETLGAILDRRYADDGRHHREERKLDPDDGEDA